MLRGFRCFRSPFFRKAFFRSDRFAFLKDSNKFRRLLVNRPSRISGIDKSGWPSATRQHCMPIADKLRIRQRIGKLQIGKRKRVTQTLCMGSRWNSVLLVWSGMFATSTTIKLPLAKNLTETRDRMGNWIFANKRARFATFCESRFIGEERWATIRCGLDVKLLVTTKVFLFAILLLNFTTESTTFEPTTNPICTWYNVPLSHYVPSNERDQPIGRQPITVPLH